MIFDKFTFGRGAKSQEDVIKGLKTDNRVLNNSYFMEDMLMNKKKKGLLGMVNCIIMGKNVRHKDSGYYRKCHVDERCYEMSQGNIVH